MLTAFVPALFSVLASPTPAPIPTSTPPAAAAPVVVRLATFNVEDVRTEDVLNPAHPRLRRIAEVIQRIRPTVILLNEVTYDMKGGPGYKEGEPEGRNGQRFAETFLATPQASDVAGIKYRAFTGPTNTGLFSGHDLDRDGKVVSTYPTPAAGKPDGSPGEQTPEGRAFGNDCFGFGTFPGQYGMTLLVDERLTIDEDAVRTFQMFPWDYLPASTMPTQADGAEWYPAEVKPTLRLASKSIWDVPVKLPNGAVFHVICSHPTPPAFDGPEQRNKKRNHDEIRFLRDYVDNAPYLVDDKGVEGGIVMRKDGPQIGVVIPFAILGDLNADPKDGDSYRSPIAKLLFKSRHINAEITPVSDIAVEGLDPWDTSSFKLRVDYVLPSKSVRVLNSGVWRAKPSGLKETDPFPSDHYPVWMEVEVPAPEK